MNDGGESPHTGSVVPFSRRNRRRSPRAQKSEDELRNLVRISTAQIVCFELAESVDCHVDTDTFVSDIYRVTSRCLDGSLTCAQTRGFQDLDSMIGSSLSQVFPPSDGFLAVFRSWHTQKLSAAAFELDIINSSGRHSVLQVAIYGRIDADERLSRIWLVARDVTSHLRALQALAQTELHYRALLERPGILYARVTASGYYEYISADLATRLGVSLEDIASRRRNLCEWVHPEDHSKVDELLSARADVTSDAATDIELRLKLSSEYRFLSVRQLPAFDATGAVRYFDLLATDITDIRQLERELNELRPQALASEKSLHLAEDITIQIQSCLSHLQNVAAKLPESAKGAAPSLSTAIESCRSTLHLARTLTRLHSGDGNSTRAKATISSQPESRPPPPIRVLVADDENSILNMLELALSRRGYNVEAVADADSLLHRITDAANKYDVLVLDESLPKKRSQEVVPYLRTLLPNTPIIVTSGNHTLANDIRSDGRSIHFLPKPFGLSELDGAIKALLQ